MLKSNSEIDNDENVLKRVTLRGIDTTLYDLVSHHARVLGQTMGEFFSRIIRHSKVEHRPPFPYWLKWRFNRSIKQMKIEFIEELQELIVTKEDLIALGPRTAFSFFRIKNLTFTSDVDSETLLKHIVSIDHCKNVVMQGEIPRLIEMGLVRRKREYININSELKDITIRNVSKTDYHEFLAQVKKENKTVGEKLNEILSQIVPNLEIRAILFHLDEPDALVLSSLEELIVTRYDLEDLEHRKVIFYEINKLIFQNDIPPSVFQNKILGIYKCQEIEKPDNIPQLIWYARIKK